MVPLAAAHLRDADPFIRRLLEANKNDFRRQRPLFLAASALAEGAPVREKTRQAVLDGLSFLARALGTG